MQDAEDDHGLANRGPPRKRTLAPRERTPCGYRHTSGMARERAEDDMKRIGLFIVVAAACLALTGCAAGAPSAPDTEPDIRGVVTDVSSAGGSSASLRVVWTEDAVIGAQTGYDAAQVAVNDDTELLSRAADGSVADAEIEEIAVGTVVEAWFEGPVAESYPVQAMAGTIVIVGTYSGELPEPPGLGE